MKTWKITEDPARVGLGAFAIVFIGQTMWIFFFGVDVPQGDQWDGEYFWYKALVTNNASWDALIAPHNEHRIAATRLFNSAIFLLIGGWRPIVVMYLQAILISGVVGWFCALLARHAGVWRTPAIVFTLLAFLSPYSWQNTLGAFQNQFYFMLLFAIVTMSLLAWNTSWPATMTAIIFAALSPFTTAGGVLTIIVFIFLTGLNFFASRISLAKFGTILALILPAAVWHVTKLHHVAGHDSLRAHSITEFFVSLLKILSWPEAPIGLLLWGSIAHGIFSNYRRRRKLHLWLCELRSEQIFILGALMWLFLQIAATAFSRTHSDLMAARYQQTYSLIIPLFFLSLNVFAVNLKWLRSWLVVGLLTVGLTVRNGREWPYMIKGVAEMRYAKKEITKAVEVQSFAYLKSKETGEFSLGYFTAEAIWERIHDEELLPYHLWLKKRIDP